MRTIFSIILGLALVISLIGTLVTSREGVAISVFWQTLAICSTIGLSANLLLEAIEISGRSPAAESPPKVRPGMFR